MVLSLQCWRSDFRWKVSLRCFYGIHQREPRPLPRWSWCYWQGGFNVLLNSIVLSEWQRYIFKLASLVFIRIKNIVTSNSIWADKWWSLICFFPSFNLNSSGFWWSPGTLVSLPPSLLRRLASTAASRSTGKGFVRMILSHLGGSPFTLLRFWALSLWILQNHSQRVVRMKNSYCLILLLLAAFKL